LAGKLVLLMRSALCRRDRETRYASPTAYPTASVLILPIALLSSCSGAQSALDPAGPEASDVATLFYVMLVGGILIWLAVVSVLFYAARKKRGPYSERAAGLVILWCGVIIPVVVLAALLSYAVWLMPNVRPWSSGGQGGLRQIEVTGEQFWWRVRYLNDDGELLFETANEIVMPVGERVLFVLKAPDVIHSFWIPSLGGKMDMIPGRTNHLALEASKPGTYRGVCAEFCGPSHALMAFSVEAVELEAFEAWIANRQTPTDNTSSRGLALFLGHGCNACHAIDGTDARGTIGPNLSAFGQRDTVGAGTLPNTEEHIARFIRHPSEIKPEARMPSFGMIPEGDADEIAAYLKGLK
jgi:cytochrome c oxidase subunit 2